jgi:hypothetical protein
MLLLLPLLRRCWAWMFLGKMSCVSREVSFVNLCHFS